MLVLSWEYDVPKVSSESCSSYQNEPNLIDEDKINQSMTLLHENPYLYDSVKSDEVLAVGEGVPIHLGLDVRLLLAVLLQPLDLDLAVEVTNVADDCVVLHHHEVLAGQDVLATSGGDKDVAPVKKVV